jgi:hypothetical protein
LTDLFDSASKIEVGLGAGLERNVGRVDWYVPGVVEFLAHLDGEHSRHCTQVDPIDEGGDHGVALGTEGGGEDRGIYFGLGGGGGEDDGSLNSKESLASEENDEDGYNSQGNYSS